MAPSVSASRRYALIVAALCCGACTVLPTVQYFNLTEGASRILVPADEGGIRMLENLSDTFYLRQSAIVIEPQSSSSAPKELTGVKISSTPVEYTQTTYGIRPVTNWMSSTAVTLNKTDNTNMISSADVSVTDKRAGTISSIGAIVVKGLAIASLTKAVASSCAITSATPKATIDLSEIKAQKGVFDMHKIAGYEGCQLQVEYGALPVGAIEAGKLPLGTNTHTFYYSACRDVTVTLKSATVIYIAKLRIADPRYLQFVQFPAKGSITMHSVCGASVKMESAAADTSLAIAEALATQTAAIIEAAKQ